MNASGMNVLGVNPAALDFSPEFCASLCLALAHSVWQIAILALLATLAVRCQRRERPEHAYAIYVAALLVALATLPITFAIVNVAPSAEFVLSESSHAMQANPNVEGRIGQGVLPEIAPPAVTSLDTSPSVTNTPTHHATLTDWMLAYSPWLAACYVAGVMLMFVRLASGIWKSQHLARHAEPIAVGPVLDSLNRLVRAWQMAQPVIAHAQNIVVPQVVGLLRPIILLPTAMLTGLTTAETEMILAHELAHVRRHDLWICLVQRLAEIALFFNPGLWYLSRRVSAYREYCCDEQTCRLESDHSNIRLRYAEALLRVVELSGKTSRQSELLALAATGNRPSELRRRVARLFGEPLREPMGISRNGLLILIVGTVFLFAGPANWQNAAETSGEKDKQAESNSAEKVEVVAIGTHDEEPQRWWDAEGQLLESVPFTWKKEPGEVSTPDKLWRRVVIRINGTVTNSPQDRIWQIVGARGSAGGTITHTEGFEPGTYLSRYFSLADGSNSFGIRFGLALGEWKTIANASGMGAHGFEGKSVVFSEPMASGEGIDVIVSHNVIDQAYRVVAVDKQGNKHESVRGGGSSAGAISQSRATFPRLALAELDHFEFQTREYEWTEIEDLPVKPGEKVAKVESGPSRLVEEVSSLARISDSGVVAVPRAEADNRFNWLSESKDLHYYHITSKAKFWRSMERRFDAIAKYPGAFAGAIDGYTFDPYGPQVDLQELYGTSVGDGFFFQNSKQDLLLGWELTNPQAVADALERIAAAEPEYFQATQIGDVRVWIYSTSDEFIAAVCVWRNCLIQATQISLLEQLLTTPEADTRDGETFAANDTSSQSNKLDSAKIAALKELVESYEADFNRVETLHKLGVVGGEAATKAQAQLRLSVAHSDLAEAEGKLDDRVKQLSIALAAAEELVAAQEARYAAANVTLEAVLAAKSERAKVKIVLVGAQEAVDKATESGENVQPNTSQPKEMRVSVVDADGNPLEGAWLFRNLTFVDTATQKTRVENETYYTDKNGDATIVLDAGTINLNLWVKKQGFVPLVTSWRDVSSGEGDELRDSFEFRMASGTKIGGIVTNVAGIPIPGVKVEVKDDTASRPHDQSQPAQRPGRSSWLAYGSAGVITDADGKWSLDNVPTDGELLANKEKWTEGQTPLRLRFSHPDYETIDGMEDRDKVGHPPLESLRDGSARTVMKWVDRDSPGRVNAIRLEQGEQYRNADFSGRYFKGQEIMVWHDNKLAGANLVGSTWENMLIPGMSNLLHEADLSRASLIDVQLSGQSGGMQETKFYRARIENSDISSGVSGLQKAIFTEATITNSYLSGEGSSFQLADFQKARLHSSKLTGAGPAFQKANLNDAKLYRTTISCDSPTAFQGVKLNDTEFVECDLSSIDAEALKSCEFDSETPPRYDAKTKLPKEFDPKDEGWKLID